MQQIVKNQDNFTASLTKTPFSFNHRLAETGMFEDERLGRLIETARQAGPENYSLGALDSDGYGTKWQTGVLGKLKGDAVLDAIKKGRLWLQIQNLADIAPDYFALAEQAYKDIAGHARGFSYHNLLASVLISSPSARVLCHIDCAEVMLFHIRGRKRVWLYDRKGRAAISDEAIEKVILREVEEEIDYVPDWDKDAFVYELEPGMAVNWPHLWPHRVDNIDGLNVSMQTEFYSGTGLRRYGVRYFNGLMRRWTGFVPRSTRIGGVTGLAKAGLGLVAKKAGVFKPAERKIVSKFTVDPDQPGSIARLSNDNIQVLAK